MKDVEIFNDSFQNWKTYQLPKAQLILQTFPINWRIRRTRAIHLGT